MLRVTSVQHLPEGPKRPLNLALPEGNAAGKDYRSFLRRRSSSAEYRRDSSIEIAPSGQFKSYFLTYFFKTIGPTSAPYTFPS